VESTENTTGFWSNSPRGSKGWLQEDSRPVMINSDLAMGLDGVFTTTPFYLNPKVI
jgi:hypothetical protein